MLKVNPDTGASDLSMDPTNPRILYAGMWHHGRNPWFIKSGGEVSLRKSLPTYGRYGSGADQEDEAHDQDARDAQPDAVQRSQKPANAYP